MNGKGRIGQLVALTITIAAIYYGVYQHNMLAAGICFIAIGLINLLTRTTFSLLIMVGLFCVSLQYNGHISSMIMAFLLSVMTFAQLCLIKCLLRSRRSAGQNSDTFRKALWEHDLVIWLVYRYKEMK